MIFLYEIYFWFISNLLIVFLIGSNFIIMVIPIYKSILKNNLKDYSIFLCVSMSSCHQIILGSVNLIVLIIFCRRMVQIRSGLNKKLLLGDRGWGRALGRGRGRGQCRPRGVDRNGQPHRISSSAPSSALRVEVEDSQLHDHMHDSPSITPISVPPA